MGFQVVLQGLVSVAKLIVKAGLEHEAYVVKGFNIVALSSSLITLECLGLVSPAACAFARVYEISALCVSLDMTQCSCLPGL